MTNIDSIAKVIADEALYDLSAIIRALGGNDEEAKERLVEHLGGTVHHLTKMRLARADVSTALYALRDGRQEHAEDYLEEALQALNI